MQRILRWVIGLPLVLLVIVFAVANRQSITVSLDPFSAENPFASLTMPLWAVLFCGIFLGIFLGWIACWFAQGKWRRALKETRRELASLQASRLEVPSSTLPMLPPAL